MDNGCLKIGHRGANGYCEGNTLFCFEIAVELGVDMVELDVHLRGNKLFVVHNIKKLRPDNPTLEQVIELVDKRVKMNIELKGRGTAAPTALLLKKYIKKGWDRDYFMVSSFRAKELRDFQNQHTGIKIGLLARRKKRIAKDLNLCSVNPALRIADKRYINKLHGRGFKVFVWTVNKEKDIRELMSFGADGIISDYPDRVA
jgi:glycerophosphoryl diester phosphodiesterase